MIASDRASVELHCHIDGCVRVPTIAELARAQGVELGGDPRTLAVAPSDCGSLLDYIRAIDVALTVLQTPDALFRAAYELVETWASDGVLHGEARFAPALHTRNGLRHREIVDSVADGLRAGSERFAVDTSLILSCMRPADPGLTWSIVELAATHDAVAGVDVAGPEQGVSLLPHAPAFRAGKDAGLRITVHAGEAGGAENVWAAIDELGAERIGHGIRAIEDHALVQRLATDRILLEVCPTSNVQTRATPALRSHPLNDLRRSGVPVSISTDARTVSQVTMHSEYELVRDSFGWQHADWQGAQRAALDAAFMSDTARADTRRSLERAWADGIHS